MSREIEIGQLLDNRFEITDYCQRELLFDVQWKRMELVWKSHIVFGDKALGLKETVTDVIHYCQLDWMKALQH